MFAACASIKLTGVPSFKEVKQIKSIPGLKELISFTQEVRIISKLSGG
jgi:hypothetical protein